jgi:hypothetical protein
MKKKFDTFNGINFEGYIDLNQPMTLEGYEDLNQSYSVRYRVDKDSDIYDPNTWYIMGVDVAEEPESVKVQRKRDQKIDSILN